MGAASALLTDSQLPLATGLGGGIDMIIYPNITLRGGRCLATILGDGSVALILDLPGLIRLGHQSLSTERMRISA